MAQDLDAALEQLRTTSERLLLARQLVFATEPEQSRDLRAARDAGATEAQLVEASGLSRVTVWKRLKA